jgi:hypothetical protein
MADFQDITPAPNPTPKKRYVLTPANGVVVQPIAWPAGVTFQNALGAALPAIIRNKVNLADFTFSIVIEANEN